MNTGEKFVITISREVGSGGRTIGRKLADRLGVRYCDKDLARQLIEQFDLSLSRIEEIKARRKNKLKDFLDSVHMPVRPDAYLYRSPYDLRKENAGVDDIFLCEKEILTSLAEGESCVIAGRSGFFILKDHPNKLDIFIRASEARRISRIMRRQGVSAGEAARIMKEVDEGRDNFVKRYTGLSRYDIRNYDLVLNVDGMDEDAAVDCILQYIGGR